MLTIEEFEKITDELIGVTEYLYFHLMGEPLLHPDLKEFIKCNPNDLADYHYTIGLWFRNRIMTKPVITNFFDELNIKNKDI